MSIAISLARARALSLHIYTYICSVFMSLTLLNKCYYSTMHTLHNSLYSVYYLRTVFMSARVWQTVLQRPPVNHPPVPMPLCGPLSLTLCLGMWHVRPMGHKWKFGKCVQMRAYLPARFPLNPAAMMGQPKQLHGEAHKEAGTPNQQLQMSSQCIIKIKASTNYSSLSGYVWIMS